MKEICSVLYIDPQAQKHAGFCRRCGGCLYLPGLRCIRCERDRP